MLRQVLRHQLPKTAWRKQAEHEQVDAEHGFTHILLQTAPEQRVEWKERDFNPITPNSEETDLVRGFE